MTIPMLVIRAAQPDDLQAIQSLLQLAKLPFEDVNAHLQHFLIAMDASRVVGCVGLEVYGKFMLYRSLAVHPDYRNGGLGRQLTDRALNLARSLGGEDMYLLTNDAAEYFRRQAFVQANREEAPDSIRNTLQFRSLCPSSAVLMRKSL